MRYVRKRIDHWCLVVPVNPNPRVHRFSGEASFPNGTVEPRIEFFLYMYLLDNNDGFSLSHLPLDGYFWWV